MLAGSFEREAIRPYVLGRFGDMLKAVEQHPAMLYYLDNQQSIGPASRAGQQGKRGLNENLAREILELHTLGVDGGYTQADVSSLSRIITGWTVAEPDKDPELGGRFSFAAARHEPGDHAVLGKVYAGGRPAPGRGRAGRPRRASVDRAPHRPQAGAPFRRRRAAAAARGQAGEDLPGDARRPRAR